MYKWFLAWRYLHTKLIAAFGVLAVMLCVAMVLVVMSVMGGFLDNVRNRSRGLYGEVVLDSGTLQGFPLYAEFAEHITRTMPGTVKQATPTIISYGIFRVPETSYTKPAQVFGVRLDEYRDVTEFGEGLFYDSYFPGTTSFAPQGMPVAGVDDKGAIRLPPALTEANQRWRAGEKNPDRIAVFDADPYVTTFYPSTVSLLAGERVFAAQPGEPMVDEPMFDGLIAGTDLLFLRRPDGKFDRVLAKGATVALVLMTLSPSGNLSSEPPVKVPLRYVDDVRTGIYEVDSKCVYVDFNLLQHKLAMDAQPLVEGGTSRPRANQLLIDLHDGVNMNDGRDSIAAVWMAFTAEHGRDLAPHDQRLLGHVSVNTWEDMQRSFIQAVEKEKVLVTIILCLISVVAIILVGCIFYMIVEKKTKDIGILKAIGASPSGVAGMFILYAAAIGVVGSALGVMFGTVFVWNINGIQDALASLNPQLRVWSPDIYSFDRIPEVVKSADAISIAIVATISSIVGSLIPAWIAGRVWPVQALRYE